MMHAPIRLFAVIVLYESDLEHSLSVRTLLQSQQSVPSGRMELRGLLFDNTPGETARGEDAPPPFRYDRPGKNLGLAVAYNRAIELAEQEGCEWLLTLDQDTSLPQEFLPRVAAHIERFSRDESVAAVLPHLGTGRRHLSPTHYVLGAFGANYLANFSGFGKPHTYAFNSGSILRVKSLREIGGYDPRFWLDYSDFSTFRRLQKAGKRLFVAGDLRLEHRFSMLDRMPGMSAFRYRNIVAASSAFYDMEMNRLAALDYDLRLALRYFRHMGRRGNREFQKITAAMLKKRLFQVKSDRLREWERESVQRER